MEISTPNHSVKPVSNNYHAQKPSAVEVNQNPNKRSGDRLEVSAKPPVQTPVESKNTISEELREKITEFREEVKMRLIKMLTQSSDESDSLSNLIDPMLYNVADDQEVAEVPEYWNADNTSQRIVDFAASFAEGMGEGKTEFLIRLKDAATEGFRQAKDMLGALPGGSAKLFNDTYQLTMSKFDDLIAQHQKGQSESLNLVA
jgi:hypothetical protein